MDADLLLSLPQSSTVKNINYTLFLMMFFLRWVLQDWGHCRSMGMGGGMTPQTSWLVCHRRFCLVILARLQCHVQIWTRCKLSCTFCAWKHIVQVSIWTTGAVLSLRILYICEWCTFLQSLAFFPSLPSLLLVCRVIFLESRFSTDVTRLIAGRGEESTEGVNSNAKIAKNECFTFGFCIFLYVVEIVRCWIS